MYNARTKPYTYIWTYTSSAEFVYEKLIETKKIELKRSHKRKRKKWKKGPFTTYWKHQPGLNVPAPGQGLGAHLVLVDNSNRY
jgi:hypothetical protein